jgi:hypothetical protein
MPAVTGFTITNTSSFDVIIITPHGDKVPVAPNDVSSPQNGVGKYDIQQSEGSPVLFQVEFTDTGAFDIIPGDGETHFIVTAQLARYGPLLTLSIVYLSDLSYVSISVSSG